MQTVIKAHLVYLGSETHPTTNKSCYVPFERVVQNADLGIDIEIGLLSRFIIYSRKKVSKDRIKCVEELMKYNPAKNGNWKVYGPLISPHSRIRFWTGKKVKRTKSTYT